MIALIKKSIIFTCLGTFVWAETITLAPIDIHETMHSSGIVVQSEKEALKTNIIALQERLKNNVSFSVVVDRKGEVSISLHSGSFNEKY